MATKKPKSARFWIFTDAETWVRITVREGSPVELGGGGPTDEGWSRWGESYSLSDGVVTRESWSDGADCDGRLSSYSRDVCPVDRLGAWEGRQDGQPPIPDWQDAEHRQRDYAAEAAGY